MGERLAVPNRFITGLFLVVLVGAGYLVFELLQVFLTTLVLSAVLVSLSGRLHQFFLDRTGRAAAALTTTVVTVSVLGPLLAVGAALTNQVVGLYQRLRAGDFASELNSLITGRSALYAPVIEAARGFGFDLTPERAAGFVNDAATSAGVFLYEKVTTAAPGALVLLVQGGILVVLVYSLLLHGSQLKTFLLDLSPLPDDEELMLVDRFREISRAVFLGNGVASVVQGVFGGLLFSLFDLGPGVLWGTVIAVLAFLPIVGASVVFLPAAGYLLLRGEVGMAVGYTFLNLVYVMVFEYAVKPRLIGGRAQLPSVLVFLGILAGLQLYGIIGLFYGPLLLTMFLTLVEIYKERYRHPLLHPEAYPEARPRSPRPEAERVEASPPATGAPTSDEGRGSGAG